MTHKWPGIKMTGILELARHLQNMIALCKFRQRFQLRNIAISVTSSPSADYAWSGGVRVSAASLHICLFVLIILGSPWYLRAY